MQCNKMHDQKEPWWHTEPERFRGSRGQVLWHRALPFRRDASRCEHLFGD